MLYFTLRFILKKQIHLAIGVDLFVYNVKENLFIN